MRTVIGLVGPIASGKGTVAQILREFGFEYYSLSDRIREELTKRQLPITREWLQNMGDELRGKYGEAILAQRTSELIAESPNTKIVVDSIRNPSEIKFLRELLDATVTIIGVDASPETRWKRFVERGRNENVTTKEEFLAMDARETQSSGESHKIDITECLKLADRTFENEGTTDDLMRKLDKFFRETKETGRRRKEG